MKNIFSIRKHVKKGRKCGTGSTVILKERDFDLILVKDGERGSN